MNRLQWIAAVVSVVAIAGCAAHDAQGREVRTGPARFDAQSVTSPKAAYSLAGDGTWGGLLGDRYERVYDAIRKVDGFSGTPSLILPSGNVRIERLPDGVMYVPSYYSAVVWIFVTEDGNPLPENLEVPLYLATRLGLGGQWINVLDPADDAGLRVDADCGLVLFDIQGRRVAGWLNRRGAVCPAPKYPGKETLAHLVQARNEVWESPDRPAPWGK
jgi:hypothetical protein